MAQPLIVIVGRFVIKLVQSIRRKFDIAGNVSDAGTD